MLTALFLAFVIVMAVMFAGVCLRFLDRRSGLRITLTMFAWLIYVGLIAYSGVVANTAMRPPGITFIFAPVIAFLLILLLRTRSTAGARFALMFPLWLLLGAQVFRVGVELFLHVLWLDGLVPKMLTFSGANVDIFIGATAPLKAWLSTRGREGQKLAFVWNTAGLLVLLNVVIRAVLTAPGPLNLVHAEVPNRMIATFPFTFIPGFFVPAAILLHVLAIRAIRSVSATSIQPAS
jgi:hypothetical protein